MKKRQQNQVFSINALAAQIGKDRRTITAALRGVRSEGKTSQGFPGWTLKTALAALANVNGGANPQAERARLDRARAELAELTMREKSAQLIPADQVDIAWQRIAVTLRTRLLAIPSSVAPKINPAAGTAKIEALIRDAIDAALTELSNATLEDDGSLQPGTTEV